MNKNDFITLSEVAEILHISKQKINSIVKSGELKVIKIGPRTRRISKSDLEEYINNKIST